MYDDVMIFVVVPCYSCCVCNLVPIHIVILSCHLITHIFLGTPHFAKLYNNRSHISFSVNYVLFIPCTSLGGAHCTTLENKTLLCLIVEKLQVLSSITKMGQIESASWSHVGFGGLMINN
jgi:hypothetical protein